MNVRKYLSIMLFWKRQQAGMTLDQEVAATMHRIALINHLNMKAGH